MKKYFAILLAAMLSVSLFTPVTAHAATETAPAAITPAQAIQQAFALYVNSGIDMTTAKQRVQEKAAEIIANPAGYAALVQPDVDALKAQLAATAAAAPAAAPAATPAITPAQAIQQAFALYVNSGIDMTTAKQRVQEKAAEIIANPAGYAALVQPDVDALKAQLAAAVPAATPAAVTPAATPAATSAITPAQAVQQAFALYVNSGIDMATAKKRVEEKFGEIVLHPTEIASIVRADLETLTGASPAAASLTPEQIIQQVYARYLASGMTPEQAMAALQAKLMTLLTEVQ